MAFFTKIKCRSKLDYFLVISMALLFDIVTGSYYSDFYGYPSYDEREDERSNNQVCSTSGCNNAAQLIRGNIDQQVDPCNNFYDFACGGFISKAQLSPEKQSISHLGSLQDKVMNDLAETLSEPRKPSDPRIFTLVKNYYKSCMDLESIERIGVRPLLRTFDEIGGWPILEGPNWDERNFNFMKADSILRAKGFPPSSRLVKLFVFRDSEDPSKNLLHMRPPKLDIPAYLLSQNFLDPDVQRHIDFMTDIAEAFGADRKRARSQMSNVYYFEKMLFKAEQEGRTVPYDGIQTVGDLEFTLTNLPWKNYLRGLTIPVLNLQDYSKLVALNKNYFKRLDDMLPNVPEADIANYMIWRVISESIPYLPMRFRKIKMDYLKSLNPNMPIPNRSKQCVGISTDDDLGISVGVSALYTRKYFSKEAKHDIKYIVNAIVEEFKTFISQVTWLDEAAKRRAIRKSSQMKQVVGYPAELDNDTVIDTYSRNLEIEPDQFLQNILNVRRFRYDDSLVSLDESAEARNWLQFSDATTINAMYNPLSNSFVLLAAILQYPVYDHQWPAYVKFGGVGFITGHEIMHAFDVDGVKRDERGALRRQVFSSDNVEREYMRRVGCLDYQYSQYRDNSIGLAVNGRDTVNENLADNVGIRVALAAYKKWAQQHPDKAKLPGLDYTPEQLFWLSTVNSMCSKQTDRYLKMTMLEDEHTPHKFRALGLLSNMEQFAKDFNCPLGSKMNPIHKCTV